MKKFTNPYLLEKSAEMSAMDWADTAAMGASFIPVVGGAINGIWNTGRAIGHAAQGDFGKAGEKMLYAGAGLIPGGAAAAKLSVGAAKGVSTAARMASSGSKVISATGRGMQRFANSGVGQAVAKQHANVVNSGAGQAAVKFNTALGSTKPMQAYAKTHGAVQLVTPNAMYMAPSLWAGDAATPQAQPQTQPQPAASPPQYSSLADAMNGVMDSYNRAPGQL